MEVHTLDGFDFVDCYFREFAVRPQLSSITLKMEAYFPEYINQNERRLGVLTIILDGIIDIQAAVKSPFAHDLEANEVYEVKLHAVNGMHHFFISSDYLTLSVQCELVRVDEDAS
jgi:hypothetical protein